MANSLTVGQDVLVAMKLVEFPKRVFGVEAAGIVRRTESNVTTPRVGDQVAVVDTYLMSTVVITKGVLCVKLPDSLSFESAACMLVPYSTAIHSLINVGDLLKG